MFCEKCKKNEATIHLTEILKNKKTEVHLCEKCSREMGINSGLSGFSLSVPEMLSFLDVEDFGNLEIKNCKTCGMTFNDYKKNGKVGCEDCYIDLMDYIRPDIISYKNECKHIGKIPSISSEKPGLVKKVYKGNGVSKLNDYKIQLENAVIEERYEDAAILRDRINNLYPEEVKK